MSTKGHKWTEAQRTKFTATMVKRRKRKFTRAAKAPATEYVTSRSHFFRIRNGRPYPVRVKRITLLVVE